MAGPDPTGEKDKDIKLEATAPESPIPQPEANDTPEVIEPITEDAVDMEPEGADAPKAEVKPETPQNDGATVDDPDTTAAETDHEESSYGFHAKAAVQQYNDGLSGAGLGKTSTTFTATDARHEEQKRREAEERAYIMLNGLETWEQVFEALEKLGQDLDVLEVEINQAVLAAKAHQSEFEQRLEQLEKKLEELKAEYATAEGERAETLQIEIESMEKLIADYKDKHEMLHEASEEAQNRVNSARAEYERALQEAQDYKDKGEEVPQNVKDSVLRAQEKYNEAVEGRDTIVSRNAFIEKYLEKSIDLQNDILKNGGQCTLDGACQRAAFIDTLIEASADGKFTQNELATLEERLNDMKAVMDAGGVSEEFRQQKAQEFFADIAASGMVVEDKDGNELTGDKAAYYLQSLWMETNEKVTEDIDNTRAEIEKSTKAQEEAMQQLKDTEARMQAMKDYYEDVKANGTPEQIRAAFLGINTLATNGMMSYYIQTVTDQFGNEVHRDFENDSYYYIDKNGERVDYTEQWQIDQFEAVAKGSDPYGLLDGKKAGMEEFMPNFGMKSVDPMDNGDVPPMRFANEKADLAAYDTAWQRYKALQEVEAARAALESVNSDIAKLQGELDIQKADLEALSKLKEDFESKNITKEEYEASIKAIAAKYDTGENTLAAKEEAKEAADTDQDSERNVDDKLAMDVPEYSFEEAAAAKNSALEAIEKAALEGGTITKEAYDMLSQLPGMSPAIVERMLYENDVDVSDAIQPTVERDVMELFGTSVPITSIAVSTVEQDPNGITPYAGPYVSVAEEYGISHALDGPLNNGTDGTSPASAVAGLAFSGVKPEETTTDPAQTQQPSPEKENEPSLTTTGVTSML